ncbi:unknown [Akkermansia muciniphila CAG:154]|nr:unknown [Akkermansia muciniphila CAG:154]
MLNIASGAADDQRAFFRTERVRHNRAVDGQLAGALFNQGNAIDAMNIPVERGIPAIRSRIHNARPCQRKLFIIQDNGHIPACCIRIIDKQPSLVGSILFGTARQIVNHHAACVLRRFRKGAGKIQPERFPRLNQNAGVGTQGIVLVHRMRIRSSRVGRNQIQVLRIGRQQQTASFRAHKAQAVARQRNATSGSEGNVVEIVAHQPSISQRQIRILIQQRIDYRIHGQGNPGGIRDGEPGSFTLKNLGLPFRSGQRLIQRQRRHIARIQSQGKAVQTAFAHRDIPRHAAQDAPRAQGYKRQHIGRRSSQRNRLIFSGGNADPGRRTFRVAHGGRQGAVDHHQGAGSAQRRAGPYAGLVFRPQQNTIIFMGYRQATRSSIGA